VVNVARAVGLAFIGALVIAIALFYAEMLHGYYLRSPSTSPAAVVERPGRLPCKHDRPFLESLAELRVPYASHGI